MDKDLSKEKINIQLKKLPKNMQEAISATDWLAALSDIGNRYNLSDEEVFDFQMITLLALMGLIEPDLYALTLEDEIGLGKKEAEKMADEAADKVFAPITETMRKMGIIKDLPYTEEAKISAKDALRSVQNKGQADLKEKLKKLLAETDSEEKKI